MIKTVIFKIVPLALMGIVVMSYASKAPPEGNTGSPTDGKSCASAGCHSGSTIAGSNMITHNIPPEGYKPGKNYTIEVKVSKASSSKFGFQFTAEKSDGTAAGSLTSGGASTVVSNTGKYVSHAGNQVTGAGGSKSWAFTWTAPAANTGTVKFYVAGNASNGNGNTSGDEIQLSSEEVKEQGVETGIESVSVYNGFHFYPNPASENLNLKTQESGMVTITNISGEVQSQIEVESGLSKIDLSTLKNGVYFISFSNDEGVLSNQTLIKY